jgi:hypothetical protein
VRGKGGFEEKACFCRCFRDLGNLLSRFWPFLGAKKPSLGAEKPLFGAQKPLFDRKKPFWGDLGSWE